MSSSGRYDAQVVVMYLVCHLRHLLGDRASTRRGMDRTGIGCGENARVGGDCFSEHDALVNELSWCVVIYLNANL